MLSPSLSCSRKILVSGKKKMLRTTLKISDPGEPTKLKDMNIRTLTCVQSLKINFTFLNPHNKRD